MDDPFLDGELKVHHLAHDSIELAKESLAESGKVLFDGFTMDKLGSQSHTIPTPGRVRYRPTRGSMNITVEV